MFTKSIAEIIAFASKLDLAGDPVMQFLPWPQVESWLQAGEWEKVRFLLRKLPLSIIPDTPEFFYMRGHALWGQHRLEEARSLFEKAHYFYRLTCDNLILSALSCLEIADIAHSRRNYQEATHYLQTAATLLATAPAVNPYVTARYELVQAVVLHDLGRFQATIDHAKAANYRFETVKDVVSQFFCAMAIASAAVHLGNLKLAEEQTGIARNIFTTNTIPPLYYARILNSEVHIAWHYGNLTQALKSAVELEQYATAYNIPHQRLYATVLQGHLQRANGDYTAAAQSYNQAEVIANAIDHHTYLIELTLHRAWLQLFTGAIETARTSVQAAAEQMTIGQWIGANMVLAVADLLEGAGDNGAELLTAALAYQRKNEPEAGAGTLHCYLALAFFRNGDPERGQYYTNEVLRWLNEHNLAYLAHWWHPILLAEWVSYVLRYCTPYTHVLQRLCKNHLGDVVLGRLAPLLHSADSVLRLRAQQLLDTIQPNNSIDLDFVKDERVRAALRQLLAEGKLRKAGLSRLFAKLTTAEYQQTPNPTLVAVFGLYLAGLPREAIAEQLGYSVQLVRNYISEIYARFNVNKAEWPKKKERWERLYTLAREEGFL